MSQPSPPGLVIVVPMLGRAHRVQPLVASIAATAPAARVLFALTDEDVAVHKAVAAAGCDHIDVDWEPHGDYARKINAGYRASTEPLIFCGADDLLFRRGWLPAALAELRPGIGVVGTNDLGNPRVIAGVHATHCLVTRAYADQFGTIDERAKILHEGYWHEYVDDELVETAKARGAWAMASQSKVEHLHPNWDKAETDPLYNQQRNRMVVGQRLYRQRRVLWT